MDRRLLNKGYTMVEMLIVLVIISIFTLVTVNRIVEIDNTYYEFSNKYNFYKSIALANSEVINFDENIRFNTDGNVNQARTINFENGKKIIIELGYGVLSK